MCVIWKEDKETGFSAKARSEMYKRGTISLTSFREGHVDDDCFNSAGGRMKGTRCRKNMAFPSSCCCEVVTALGLAI